MTTANIKFNRVVAKNNFKYDTLEELKDAIMKSTLSETGLVVTDNMRKAREIINPDKSLEVQQEVASESIAFLSDESAVSVRLIQVNAHGIAKFGLIR